jgi:hypothetical protein
MDATQLIGPASPLGLPAPYWLIAAFKVLGFTLHMIPMNLWFVGILVAMLLRRQSKGDARLFADRLMSQMPIIIALGINLGIVPLLFTQVAYYRVFYPATILMAWPWFAVIVLLVFAYYGVYLYAVGLRREKPTAIARAAGWAAAFIFVVIGFTFSSAFSLMTNLAAWPALWRATAVGGAVWGTATNVGDPTLLPRWLMVIGLALTTTAAYVTVDAGLLARGGRESYRRWAPAFALRLYTFGIVWFAAAGSWYVFGTWQGDVRQFMFALPLLILTALTAVAPGLPWLLILAQRRGATPALAALTGAAQVGVLAANGISRQVVQNAELRRFLDVTSETVRMQWSPLLVFLILFVAGLAVVAWMVRRVWILRPAPR